MSKQYTFTDNIYEWMQDNAREIAEHLWAPNLGHGWRAWIYVDGGEIKCSYHTASTAPGAGSAGGYLILNVWYELEGEFDDDYSEVDYIADYIYQGSLDCEAGT